MKINPMRWQFCYLMKCEHLTEMTCDLEKCQYSNPHNAAAQKRKEMIEAAKEVRHG